MPKPSSPAQSIYEIPIQTIHGETVTLAPFKGKVMLIVNVASRCGFTKQYAELEALYQRFKDQGLVILGFPCNQFFNQEPGSNQEINTFATSCFRVTFPLFEKINVKGTHQSPLYRFIQHHIQKKPWLFVPWNFTKFIVKQDGVVLKQFHPLKSIATLTLEIERLLNEKKSY